MVLTLKQLENFKNGTLSKSLFLKMLLTIDFENYLYRYCKIVNDFRDFENRTTTFKKYGYIIEVYMEFGKCKGISYKQG